MTNILSQFKTDVYDKCSLDFSDFIKEPEGKEYNACRFTLNGQQILCRDAKITPKKIGQFVTCWKRNTKGITEPFNESDEIDFYIINTQKDDNLGQFIFPKSILIAKGIISTDTQEGKRGFRVYPEWDNPLSKQAQKTQNWQLNHFYKLNDPNSLQAIKGLFGNPKD